MGDAAERRLDRLLDLAREARENPAGFDLTHDGLALEFGQLWQHDARHVPLWGKWLFFSGARWLQDDQLAHMTHTRAFLRGKAEELLKWAEAKQAEAEAMADGKEKNKAVQEAEKALTWAKGEGKGLRSAPMVANVVGLARSNRRAGRQRRRSGTPTRGCSAPRAAPSTCAPGACGPRDGAPTHPDAPPSRRPRRARRRRSGGLPGAHLRRRPGDDPLRAAGRRLRLTGSVEEHALFFLWGQGANGKGVFFNTLRGCSATTPPWRRSTCFSSARPTGTRPTWRCCAGPGW